MLIQVQALQTQLTEEEMKAAIPPEVLVTLPKGGVLQGYIVAQEGETTPRVIGEGSQKLIWPRATVRRVKDFFVKSVQFFVGHGKTNDHEGRKTVGETVGSLVKEIGGKLSTIVIGHFPDSAAVAKMDVCSMEADVITTGMNIVSDLKRLTAVALGSSDKDSPAFPGAVRLAQLQCFEQDSDPDKNRNSSGEEGEEDMALTFEEIRKGIKDLNIMPWQVFEKEDLVNDRTFGKEFEELEKLRTENKTLLEENKKLEDGKKGAERQGQLIDAKDRLTKSIPEGATEKQKAFIKRNFNPDKMEDLSDEALKNYVVNATKEYSDVAKLFGVAEDNNSDSDSDDGSGGESTADPVTEALKETIGE